MNNVKENNHLELNATPKQMFIEREILDNCSYVANFWV